MSTATATAPQVKKPPSREAHSCPQCLRVFSRREYAVRHQRRKHPEGEYLRTDPQPVRENTNSHNPTYLSSHTAVRPPDILGRLPNTYRPHSNGSSGSSSDDEPRFIELDAPAVPAINPQSLLAPSNKRRFSNGPDLSLPAYDSNTNITSYRQTPVQSSNGEWHLPVTPPEENPEDLYKFGLNFQPSIPEIDLKLLIDNCYRGSYVTHGRREGPDGNGRYIVFNLRVVASLGTEADWVESDGALRVLNAGRSMHSQLVAPAPNNRFFPPDQRFCIGIRPTCSLPPLPRLSRWASLAAVYLLPFVPLLHTGSMFESAGMLSPLAFALSVAGAGFERSGRPFHEDFVNAKRLFAINHLHAVELTFEEQISVMQAFIIYNACALHLRSQEDQILNATSHALLVKKYKEHNFPAVLAERGWNIPAAGIEHTPSALFAEYYTWAQTETLKRISWIVMLLDLTRSNIYDEAPLLSTQEFDVDLPAPDCLWNAQTPELWLLYFRTTGVRPPSFATTIEALLSLDFPSHTSPASAILPRLPSFGPSTLALLTQALFRFQRLVERTMRIQPGSIAPVQGLPTCLLWDPPALALSKIQNGLRLLSMSGGPSVHTPWFRPLQPVFP